MLQATAADADTLDRAAYRDRLAAVRALVVSARAAPLGPRPQIVDGAKALLRRTTALDLGPGAVVPVDDGAIADRIAPDDAALDAAERDLDVLIASLDPARPIDPATADARLRQLVGEHRAREAQMSLPDLLARWLAQALAGVRGAPPDPRIVLVVAGGLGLAALALVLAVIGGDIRERFRREVVLPELRSARSADPAEHLRLADEAVRAGRPREAVHRLYLYALAELAAREIVRYDPSLTDGEVLARARTIPHADALRDLVELHGRIWYGLRDAHDDDARRARALALRAAA